MCAKNKVSSAILMVAILLLLVSAARPATPEAIETAINKGVAWLVAQQKVDGSWGTWEQVAQTGLAVVKLQDRARELGTAEYDDAIQDGLDYILSRATINPAGYDGVCFSTGGHETYSTGIAMMAIANEGDLGRVVSGGPLNGWTYDQVLQGNVDFFADSQNPDGGWRYNPFPQESDQSNTGYAVLGLSYAKNAGIPIPDSIEIGLLNWIGIIQDADGGSWYTPSWSWVNELKTGNLIFEMSFLGMGPGNAAFDRAVAYIERHWRDTNMDPGWGYNFSGNNYQAMYCLMKGLQSSGVDLIDTDGDGEFDDDWFNQEPPASPPQDFASVILATQNADGSWNDGQWGGETLGTTWALLTLEKVTVIHHIEVTIVIKPETLNLNSKGVFTAFIDLPEGYGGQDFVLSTIECEGAPALRDTMADAGRLIVKFDREDLVDVSTGDEVELIVTGELSDGTPFIGSDTIRVIDQGGKK